MSMFDSGCDWYCDCCHAYMNNQGGFSTTIGTWVCTECGTINDVSENNIIPENISTGYVYEETLEDGSKERIRYTKTREVHEFEGPFGKIFGWKRR